MGKLIDDLYSERGVGMGDIPALIEEFKSALAEKERLLEQQRIATYQAVEREHAAKKLLAEQEREIEGLTKKVENLTAWYDKMFGTPCEEIRHQQQIEQLQAELDRVTREAVWAMRLVLLDNPEGCSAWCNATEFLNSPLVQSYQARQGKETT